jgi:hypothetical protein
VQRVNWVNLAPILWRDFPFYLVLATDSHLRVAPKFSEI